MYINLKQMKYFLSTILFTFLFISCSDKKEETATNQKTVDVMVASPISQEGNAFFSASGNIEAEQFANISTRMMGYVSKVHVKVGDKVKKGQRLININNSDIEAKKAQANAGLSQAEAAFITAEKDYNRFVALYEKNSASQKEFDDMTARYEMAKAQVETARQMQNEINAMLTYTNITAPFSGVITSKSVNQGDMANPGMPLLSMETPGKYLATAMVPETLISNIKKDSKVNVRIKSTSESIKGIVSEVSTSSQNTGGQYLVKIILQNTSVKLYSGMFVSTDFPLEKGTSKNLLLPKKHIINQGQLTGVYTVSQSNTAVLRWLRLGKTQGENIEVLSGLSKDEKYITSAEGKLYNGVKLNIKK